MSVLAKLEEIEARLKAAKGPWDFMNPPQGCGDTASHTAVCEVCFEQRSFEQTHGPLIKNTPADLALLARLVRLAVESVCVECDGEGRRPSFDRGWVDCDGAVCRIRRELADGGAK